MRILNYNETTKNLDFYQFLYKNLGFFIYVCNLVSFTEFMNGIEDKIKSLREELEQHNYKYYVLSMPTISDRQYDEMMKELQLLEEQHPEFFDPHSPTQRVGSDLSKEFEQVTHRYPMLSLGNTRKKKFGIFMNGQPEHSTNLSRSSPN